MSELQIGRDLARHLDQRIEQAMKDYFDRCEIMDVNYEYAIALAMTVLSVHLATGAVAVEATETEFITMCRLQYHHGMQASDNG